MKFKDGYWQVLPGIKPHYAVQVYDIDIGGDALTVYATTRKIENRGDTTNSTIITIQYSSPMENVIRVQISHNKGGKPKTANFQLNAGRAPQTEIQDSPKAASLTSGNLGVSIEKSDEWHAVFMDGDQLITQSGLNSIGYIETSEGPFVHEQLGLDVGEYVYGLGERFTPFVKNGQVVEIWNADGGTCSEQAYKNIPFYLTNRGYGVFVNQPERVSYEIASENVERVQFSVAGESLDYFLIYGPSPKAVLERYTRLTGKPALPPAWSFGLWLSTSFTTDYDEETVTKFIDGMEEREIPLSVFHFDCFWMKAFHWSNFEWDEDLFPDPERMLRGLKGRGLKICVWINPYIAQRSALFDEAAEMGYLIKRPDGSVWQWDKWQAGMGIVDFTNPAACNWYADKLQSLVKMGVDCFKTDFGERIPTGVVYYDGSDPQRMHNFYTYLYNKTVFEMLEGEVGVGKAILFARSATTGGQQFPVHWGGDNIASFVSMAESLRGGLSLGLSGFGFWSHDIGGFDQTAPPEVYKRWCAFGLLSSHSRLHGSSSYRVPWLFDEESAEVLRYFTQLKCSLMPYLYASAVQAHQKGVPMMRAMMLEFPDDPGCETLDRQYMMGDSLLVAPVFAFDGRVTFYVPAGVWTNFITGETVEGPGWFSESHDFMSLPLLVRPNSVIPVGSRNDRPDYDYGDCVTLQIYELRENESKTLSIPAETGEPDLEFELHAQDGVISIQRSGNHKPWQVSLMGIEALSAVDGGEGENEPGGTMIKVEPKVDSIKILL